MVETSSGALHSGHRLAKPGFPGRSSNSSPQTTQVLIGNAIVSMISQVNSAAKVSWNRSAVGSQNQGSLRENQRSF
jgi:hypothetical protein